MLLAEEEEEEEFIHRQARYGVSSQQEEQIGTQVSLRLNPHGTSRAHCSQPYEAWLQPPQPLIAWLGGMQP